MRRAACFVLLLVAGTLLAGCGRELPTRSGESQGYERVALAELFTAVWCSNCPQAEAALDRLYEEEAARGPNGTPRLAVVHWHPSFGPGDPYSIPFADDRMTAYADIFGSQPALPMCIFNGVSGISSGTPQTFREYRQQFDQYAALPSPVELTLTIEDDGDHVHPLIQARLFPGRDAVELKVSAVLAENRVCNTSGMGPDTLSFVARAAATQHVALTGAEPVAVLLTLPVQPAWVRRDLHVIVFAQEAEPAAGHDFREVLQALIAPFVTGAEHGFVLEASQTLVGVPEGGTRRIPFTITNTGTLEDTLTVDLPAALIDAPASWTLRLTDAAGTPLATPHALAMPAGDVAGGLRLQVEALSGGEGGASVVVASRGDPTRADTLRFELTAGVFDLALSAEATQIDATAGTPGVAPFFLQNTGTVPDSVRIELPAALNHLPAGWTASLAGAGDTHTLWVVPSGGEDLGLSILAHDEGHGTIGVVATSRGAPSVADTLVFTVDARAYNFQLWTATPRVQAIVGEPRLTPFEIRNTGSRADLLRLDLPAGLQELPAGWGVALGYGHGLEVATPYWLPLEAGGIATRFGIVVHADAPGEGVARLVTTSAGDPSLADTLRFTISADAYGFTIASPNGTAIDLEPGTPESIPLAITNIGTVRDTLVVDMPASLQSVPNDWEIALRDASESTITLPFDLPLAPGAAQNDWHIRARAPAEGEARLALVVASRARPALRDTLRLTLTAASNAYAFELTADETVIHVAEGEFPGFAFGPFLLTSRGTLDDTIHLVTSWVTQPPEWTSIPILCEEGGLCFGPEYDAEITAGGTVEKLVVDLFVPPGGGTAVVRLTATSLADPSQTRSLDFTFTTEPAVRAGGTVSATLTGPRHADAAPRPR